MKQIKSYIKEIKNHPKEGVNFLDITPLMKDGEAYQYSVDEFLKFAKTLDVDLVVGPEARGFIFGCPVAISLGKGFIPVRKLGKLPREIIVEEYDLEYGTNELSIHKDDIIKGQRVLIIDDILATGGTVAATIKLVERLGGKVVGLSFLLELLKLEGQKKIRETGNYKINVLETY